MLKATRFTDDLRRREGRDWSQGCLWVWGVDAQGVWVPGLPCPLCRTASSRGEAAALPESCQPLSTLQTQVAIPGARSPPAPTSGAAPSGWLSEVRGHLPSEGSKQRIGTWLCALEGIMAVIREPRGASVRHTVMRVSQL